MTKRFLMTVVVLLGLSTTTLAGGLAGPLSEALGSADRDPADKARDAGRLPAKVLTFLGIEPGMTAIDLIAAGGYYTEVLSVVVGPEGKVLAQNPMFVLEFRDGANDKALTKRLADNRLPNVVRLDGNIEELGIEPGSVDLAITALNFHDIYNRNGKEAAAGFSKQVMGILKPGGVFGVIDHNGADGADNEALHRMQSSQAIEALEAAGFTIAATSSLLANDNDDLTTMVFAPEIRGKTSRFLIKALKP